MSAYTVKQLLEDAEHRRLGGNVRRAGKKGLGAAKLAEVWQVMDRYASACLEQRRGVVLPNFCRVGWQTVNSRGRGPQHRPYFVLLETFCRSYGLKTAAAAAGALEADVCIMEEFNVSKAAIRFSSALTKDDVSAGLRAIVQQLGEVVSRNRPVSLELSFGKLLASERQVALAFAPELYLESCLEPLATSERSAEGRRESHATSHTTAPSRNALTGASVRGTSEAVASGPRGGQHRAPAKGGVGSDHDSHRLGGPEVWSLDAASCSPRRAAVAAAGAPELPLPLPAQPAAAATCSPSARAMKKQQRPNPQQHAYTDALHRHIADLESRASLALRDRAQVDGQLQQRCDRSTSTQVERQAQLREHSEFLQRQIEAKEHRKRAEALKLQAEDSARAQAQAQAPCLDVAPAPERELLASEAKSARSQCRNQQDGLRRALDEQIRAKRVRKEALKDFERQLETRLLDAESQEAAVRQGSEQAARLQERELLSAAWREECRIRDIQRNIEAIELGRWVPGSQVPSAATASAAAPPPWGVGPETRPGASQGACSRGASSGSAGGSPGRAGLLPPFSARGEALGAAGSLSFLCGGGPLAVEAA